MAWHARSHVDVFTNTLEFGSLMEISSTNTFSKDYKATTKGAYRTTSQFDPQEINRIFSVFMISINCVRISRAFRMAFG